MNADVLHRDDCLDGEESLYGQCQHILEQGGSEMCDAIAYPCTP